MSVRVNAYAELLDGIVLRFCVELDAKNRCQDHLGRARVLKIVGNHAWTEYFRAIDCIREYPRQTRWQVDHVAAGARIRLRFLTKRERTLARDSIRNRSERAQAVL